MYIIYVVYNSIPLGVKDTDRIINRCYFMFTHTFQEMKGFLMPGSKSSENILSRFCPVAFVILIENLVQTLAQRYRKR